MPVFTETDLRRALADCFIPGQRRNIVAAALVRSAWLERDATAPGADIPGVPPRYIAHVDVTEPGSDEAVNAQLRAIVENRLLGLQPISRAEVALHPPLFPILN